MMPSTMAPTKAMARYAVIMLSLPANVMRSLPLSRRVARALWLTESLLPKKSVVLSLSLAAFRRTRAGMVKEG